MLENKAMKAIGRYAKEKTDFEKFGVGSPNQTEANELFLLSFALSNAVYLDEEDKLNIDKRISDLVL